MKIKTAILSSYAAYASASSESTDAASSTPAPRKMGQTKSMLAVILNMDSDDDAKALIKNYGCFCYPLGRKMVGPTLNFNGDPLDELDQLCKNMYRAQKCITIDAEDGEYKRECETSQGFAWYVDGTGAVQCGNIDDTAKDRERKACKYTMCEIELDFAHKVASLFSNGYSRNDDFFRMEETKYLSTCARTDNNGSNGQQQELACCGKGLDRRIFNNLVSDCCNDVVESIGTC